MSPYGRVYKTAEAKEYQSNIRKLFPRALYDVNCVKKATVLIEANFSSKHHSDLDNLLKLILDAFEGILYKKDRVINDLHILTKSSKQESPYLLVECVTEVVYDG